MVCLQIDLNQRGGLGYGNNCFQILATEFNRSILARDSGKGVSILVECAIILSNEAAIGLSDSFTLFISLEERCQVQHLSDIFQPDLTLPPHPSQIPTIIQFGASSPLEFSRATSLAAPHVSGIDLNCGCPQSWACADNMGAALIHKRELVAEMIKEAKATLAREGWGPTRTVSVKIRIHKDLRCVTLLPYETSPLQLNQSPIG